MSASTPLLDEITAKAPGLFALFTVHKGIKVPEQWNDGPEFVAVKLQCNCGSSKFHIKTAYRIDSTGLIFKKREKTLLPPVYLICESCGSDQLLFDSSRHGWDAMIESGEVHCEERATSLFKEEAGGVVVNYSYQGLDNYQELLDQGVSNPEDYFDTLSIYFVDAETGVPEQVVSCECA